MNQAMLSEAVTLLVEVPICAFRPHESREYQDTHPFPPPSAVYGMLLSLCGVRRQDKSKHLGARMALAIESPPERARVFRKFRRGKELGDLRPDYQDLLIGIRLWVWLERGEDSATPSLCERVCETIRHPVSLDRYGGRFGGLSLGESSYLVDSISLRGADLNANMEFLKPDAAGFYDLPVWVDHENNRNHRQRFTLEAMTVAEGLRGCWVPIVGS